MPFTMVMKVYSQEPLSKENQAIRSFGERGGVHIEATNFQLTEFKLRGMRVTIGVTLFLVFTAKTVWLPYTNNEDYILDAINPYVTLALSVGALIWAFAPPKYLPVLTEGLWLSFGWWVVLSARLVLHHSPRYFNTYERLSWFLIDLAMMVLSIGAWFTYRRFDAYKSSIGA